MLKRFLSLALLSSLFSICAYADESRTINGITWHKTKPISANTLLNQAIPYGATSLYFIRPMDNDDIQTSAVVSINDRFLTSLQPGNYSQVYSCAGINELSSEITGKKTNDLLANKVIFNLTPDDSYFFLVDVDTAGHSSIRHIGKDSALQLMQSMPHQSHQIKRTVPNCVVPPPVRPIPVAPPAPPVQRRTIDLEILFDTDKSIVKSQYMGKIAEVAAFMREYPNAVAAIEGHTDSRASDSYNQALSQRRVDAVRKILIEQYHIAPDRLNAVGYGESRPIADNSTPEGRQKNRRVLAVFDNY